MEQDQDLLINNLFTKKHVPWNKGMRGTHSTLGKGHKHNGKICPICGKIHVDSTGNNSVTKRPEVREKMRQKMIQRNIDNPNWQVGLKKRSTPWSEERKEKCRLFPRNCHKGPLSDVTLEKKRLARLKNPYTCSKETRLKMSLAKKGKHLKFKRVQKPQTKEQRLKRSIAAKKIWSDPENVKRMSFKFRQISKCQTKLYCYLKSVFPTAILDYEMFSPFNISHKMYLDIAIVEYKVNFEYDSTRYHKNRDGIDFEGTDKKRDEYLESIGWSVIRVIEKELEYYVGKGI